MFTNVLIAEDHESASISVRKSLEDLGISRFKYVYYCDEALAMIQKANHEKNEYDLLITDLFFEEDTHPQKLSGGAALIAAARKIQPGLKTLVFSAEHRAAIIEPLFDDLEINGFVRKARHDAQELKMAIERISQGRRHFPVHLRQMIQQKNAHDFNDFDTAIITLLAQGILQKDIPPYLKKMQISPSGLSSIEKRLNLIKDRFNFTKNEQLVAFCKDAGLI